MQQQLSMNQNNLLGLDINLLCSSISMQEFNIEERPRSSMLIEEGYSVSAVAKIIGCSRPTV